MVSKGFIYKQMVMKKNATIRNRLFTGDVKRGSGSRYHLSGT